MAFTSRRPILFSITLPGNPSPPVEEREGPTKDLAAYYLDLARAGENIGPHLGALAANPTISDSAWQALLEAHKRHPLSSTCVLSVIRQGYADDFRRGQAQYRARLVGREVLRA